MKPQQPSLFDEPPATPPVRHAAEQETPAAVEALRMAESAATGDVRPTPVWADVMADFFSGGKQR